MSLAIFCYPHGLQESNHVFVKLCTKYNKAESLHVGMFGSPQLHPFLSENHSQLFSESIWLSVIEGEPWRNKKVVFRSQDQILKIVSLLVEVRLYTSTTVPPHLLGVLCIGPSFYMIVYNSTWYISCTEYMNVIAKWKMHFLTWDWERKRVFSSKKKGKKKRKKVFEFSCLLYGTKQE